MYVFRAVFILEWNKNVAQKSISELINVQSVGRFRLGLSRIYITQFFTIKIAGLYYFCTLVALTGMAGEDWLATV